MSAAIIAPAALSMVMNAFTEGAERNRALGIWGGIGGFGATAGLLLGGLITHTLGWQWVFWINVPVGAVVLVLAPVMLIESRNEARDRSFDLAGALTVTSGARTVRVRRHRSFLTPGGPVGTSSGRWRVRRR